MQTSLSLQRFPVFGLYLKLFLRDICTLSSTMTSPGPRDRLSKQYVTCQHADIDWMSKEEGKSWSRFYSTDLTLNLPRVKSCLEKPEERTGRPPRLTEYKQVLWSMWWSLKRSDKTVCVCVQVCV